MEAVMVSTHERTAAVLPPPSLNVSWILGDTHLPAHVDPDSVALRYDAGALTYAELRRRALGLAADLRSRYEVGSRVAIQVTNRPEIFELYFACAFAGLTMVPLNFRLNARELAFILEDCTPSAFITESGLRESVEEAFAVSDWRPQELVVLDEKSSGDAWEAMASTPSPGRAIGHCDVQLILYTSGTTGRPKGVMMRHEGILWFATQQAIYYPYLDSSAVTMLTGPMYNTAAINEQSIPTFYVGGTVAIMPSRGWEPQSMAERMKGWGVTHAVVYPSMMEPMLAALGTDEMNLPSMKVAVTGGENCPPATMARFMEAWPHVHLIIAYGSTECGIASWITGEEFLTRPGTVGRAIGGQLFTIVDEDRVPVPAGVVGRILTASPSIVPGYWAAPELTASAIRDGWLDTGDLGRIDEDGYLYIEGRTKDMIISKGQNIYPAEIENALCEHELIVDCAVIGVPDEECGEVPCAVIVLQEGRSLEPDEVIEFVRDRLASFKKPKYVVTVDSIPRNPSAKVMKPELAERLRSAGRIPA
jgi:fatty-acyl-CoA synthase